MNGRCCRAVFSDVGEIESFRQIEIELNRAELPRPPIASLTIRSILGRRTPRLPALIRIWNAGSLQCVFQCRFRDVPIFLTSDPFGRPRTEKEFKGFKTESAQNIETELKHLVDFGGHLLRRQNKCASSCVKPRTRVSPCKTPLFSNR